MRSYRIGISTVIATVLVSAAICAPIFSKQTSPPAGELLGEGSYDLGEFELTERSGKPVRASDLNDQVWIASFIFTRCPSSCPLITKTMRGLQDQLKPTTVRLVSISVDPEFDTTEVLTEYAQKFSADGDRWWFLTGPRASLYRLILEQFKVSVGTTTEQERKAGAESVAHSDRLVLVGPGNRVVGTYVSRDPDAMIRLLRDARLLVSEGSWARQLPEVNASLNALCALLLVLGWGFILTGWARLHVATMISAVSVSALFLCSYLVYHFMVGSMPFKGYGPVRVAYFTILLSHTVLATFGVVPLVGLTLYRASRRQFEAHAQIARVTFPIWLYVSVTGVVIYWMLYRLDVAPSLG